MSNDTEAMSQLKLILIKAKNARDDSQTAGPLIAADFDELEMLADYLGDKIPRKAHKLLKSGYVWDSYKQRELGLRILRVLNFKETYGETPKTGMNSELLPIFSLGAKDKKRVMKLCSDMRKIVFSSIDFDEPHKKRLLNRIAAIEKQVLSSEGMFDVVLGGVSDIGETLRKFGKDIKPLTDRMAEVAQITRRGSKEYDQIPAPEDLKKLPPPDEDTGEDE